MKLKLLYISSIGLTDPIAGSQIIPYLLAFQRLGAEVYVISREGGKNYQEYQQYVDNLLLAPGVQWHMVERRSGLLGTAQESRELRRIAEDIVINQDIDLVHCRSYMPGLVGLFLKRKYPAIKFVFDMRGFWPDERIEGNIWKLSHPVYFVLYRFFKKKEKDFFKEADYVVSLTEAGKVEIESWNLKTKVPIAVIPCCADFDHFDYRKVSEPESRQLKKDFGFQEKDFVLLYLGSVGTWYALNEMFQFYKILKKKKGRCRFLVLTGSDQEIIFQVAQEQGVNRNDLVIRKSSRENLPLYLSIADLSVVFYRESYSRKGCSPTKIAELMGMGIPIVSSKNIGDTDTILNDTKAGVVVNDFSTESLSSSLEGVEELLQLPKSYIRQKGQEYFSLKNGIQQYLSIYEFLMDS